MFHYDSEIFTKPQVILKQVLGLTLLFAVAAADSGSVGLEIRLSSGTALVFY